MHTHTQTHTGPTQHVNNSILTDLLEYLQISYYNRTTVYVFNKTVFLLNRGINVSTSCTAKLLQTQCSLKVYKNSENLLHKGNTHTLQQLLTFLINVSDGSHYCLTEIHFWNTLNTFKSCIWNIIIGFSKYVKYLLLQNNRQKKTRCSVTWRKHPLLLGKSHTGVAMLPV